MTDKKIEGLAIFINTKDIKKWEIWENFLSDRIDKLKVKDYNFIALGWAKLPIGGENVLKLMRKSIDGFMIYYMIDGIAKYRATMKELVLDNEEYKKKSVENKWNEKNLLDFTETLEDYDYPNTTKIIFIAKELERLEEDKFIDNSAFVFYDKPIEFSDEEMYSYISIQTETDNILKENQAMYKIPLNQILYGPPGTGKTYHTINKALAIIENKTEEELKTEDREALKRRFDGYVTEGSIVFTTFHQSMSYEDFIEGIKPIEPKIEDTFIKYEVQDGIFKTVCNQQQVFNIGQKFGNHEIIAINNHELYFSKPQGGSLPISKELLNQLVLYAQDNKISDFKKLEKPNRSKYPLLDPFLINGYSNLFPSLVDYLLKNKSTKNTKKILIIDEINRGNVSQIFGELITLIEEDKRLGKDEALTVTLPYSKEKFGVPSNVYIIGTMNTADRSVEALDTALRRRFSFVEMPPQYDLAELDREVVGFKLYHILQTMNDRIEVLLNRDNLIGHSYFLKVDSEEALKETMFKNIIPLLQEYFFGDYGKIGLVLGKGFVKEEKERKKVSFATFDYPDTEGVQKTVYELRKYDEVDIEDAIKWLLNGKA